METIRVNPETSFRMMLARIARDLLIPTVVFVITGMFAWRVRGTRGFGAVPGCVFAGTLWGALWLYFSRERTPLKTRRFSTGWSFAGLAIGIAISGMHAWMQWRPWLQGNLVLGNSAPTLPINPLYGYVWLFICAAPWCGMGAVFLSWSNTEISMDKKSWVLRIVSGCTGLVLAVIAWWLLREVIVPRYSDVMYWMDRDCRNCDDAVGDTLESAAWLGLYLGFLAFEISRKHWVNAKMIVFCGVVAGVGWVLLQAWFFGGVILPEVPRTGIETLGWTWFELWAGLPFGLAFGLSYYFWNRPGIDGSTGLPAFRTNIHGKQVSSIGRNLEPILGIDVVAGVGVVFNMHSVWEGFISYETGTRPDFVPEVAIPALVVVCTLTLIHVAFITRHGYKGVEKGNVRSLRDNIGYWKWLFPILFVFTSMLGIVMGTREEMEILSSSRGFFYAYLHPAVLVANLVLLVAWHYLSRVVSVPGSSSTFASDESKSKNIQVSGKNGQEA